MSLSANDVIAAVAAYNHRTTIKVTRIPNANESSNIPPVLLRFSIIPAMMSICLSTSSLRVADRVLISSDALDIRLELFFELYWSLSLLIINTGMRRTLWMIRSAWSLYAQTMILLTCWCSSFVVVPPVVFRFVENSLPSFLASHTFSSPFCTDCTIHTNFPKSRIDLFLSCLMHTFSNLSITSYSDWA